jgi:hypothetical protein
MVEQKVLEYFRVNKGHYRMEDLKKKILGAGYSQKDINDALIQLGEETKGVNPPSVAKTVKQINKTNIQEAPVAQKSVAVAKPVAQKPVAVAKPAKVEKQVETKEPAETMVKPVKKSKKWLWIIFGLAVLIALFIGFGIWLFFFT